MVISCLNIFENLVFIAILSLTSALSYRDKVYNKDILVDITDQAKTQFHEHDFDTNAYVFGYEVGPDGQFHHENRGPDGVTYGCYGNVENDASVRVTHYVADEGGYRIVTPAEEVEIFNKPRPKGNNKTLSEIDPGNHRSNLKFGKFTPWGALYFPKGCNSIRARNGTEIYFPGVPRPKVPTNYYGPASTFLSKAPSINNIKSNPNERGQYVPDNRGQYVPDYSGKYVPDGLGKYYPGYYSGDGTSGPGDGPNGTNRPGNGPNEPNGHNGPGEKPRGPNGSSGPEGPNGPEGLNGPGGPSGPDGPDGLPVPTEPLGPSGPDGPSREDGSYGLAPKSPGSPGTPGTPGFPASGGNTSPGSPGLPGIPGFPAPGGNKSPESPGNLGYSTPGTPGTPGFPAPGITGTPGPPGVPGAPGSPGNPGAQESSPCAPGYSTYPSCLQYVSFGTYPDFPLYPGGIVNQYGATYDTTFQSQPLPGTVHYQPGIFQPLSPGYGVYKSSGERQGFRGESSGPVTSKYNAGGKQGLYEVSGPQNGNSCKSGQFIGCLQGPNAINDGVKQQLPVSYNYDSQYNELADFSVPVVALPNDGSFGSRSSSSYQFLYTPGQLTVPGGYQYGINVQYTTPTPVQKVQYSFATPAVPKYVSTSPSTTYLPSKLESPIPDISFHYNTVVPAQTNELFHEDEYHHLSGQPIPVSSPANVASTYNVKTTTTTTTNYTRKPFFINVNPVYPTNEKFDVLSNYPQASVAADAPSPSLPTVGPSFTFDENTEAPSSAPQSETNLAETSPTPTSSSEETLAPETSLSPVTAPLTELFHPSEGGATNISFVPLNNVENMQPAFRVNSSPPSVIQQSVFPVTPKVAPNYGLKIPPQQYQPQPAFRYSSQSVFPSQATLAPVFHSPTPLPSVLLPSHTPLAPLFPNHTPLAPVFHSRPVYPYQLALAPKAEVIPLPQTPAQCPCYVMSKNGAGVTATSPYSPPTGIMLLLYPMCPGDSLENVEKIQPSLSSTFVIPYSCGKCVPHRGVERLQHYHSFEEALAMGTETFNNPSLILNPHKSFLSKRQALINKSARSVAPSAHKKSNKVQNN